MYRYVFKKVKDTVEFGINVRKSFACHQSINGSNKSSLINENAKENKQNSDVLRYQEVNFLLPQKRVNFDDFKKKYNCKHPNCKSPFLQAVTWSTALIAGFYASQLLCLYRRKQRLDPKKCFYAKYLHHKNQLLHRKFLCAQQQQKAAHNHRSLVPTSFKFSCPLKKTKTEEKQHGVVVTNQCHSNVNDPHTDSSHEFAVFNLFDKRFEKFFKADDDLTIGGHRKLFKNVNNDKSTSNDTLTKSPKEYKSTSADTNINDDKQTKKEQQTEDEAIDEILTNLSDMIGELEFQMGVECATHGNYEAAVEHFRISSASNNASACFNLALLYEQGLGIKKDLKIAKRLYEIASDLGHDKAMYNLGVYFVQGLGGARRNFKKAKLYFERAAMKGNYDAKEALSLLLPDKKKSSPLLNVPDDFIVADDIGTNVVVAQNINVSRNLHSIAVT